MGLKSRRVGHNSKGRDFEVLAALRTALHGASGASEDSASEAPEDSASEASEDSASEA